MSSIQVAAYLSHPIQYFAPLFREIAKDQSIDLVVYYGSLCGIQDRLDKGFGKKVSWDIPLLGGYNHKFIKGFGTGVCQTGFWLPINPALVLELIRQKPDIIWIHGHYSANSWLGLLASRFSRSKVLIRSESNLESTPRTKVLSNIKSIVMKTILKFVDGVLYIGSKNKAYYEFYNYPDSQMYYLPYGVDNHFYQSNAEKLNKSRSVIRESFGIYDDRPVILFVGKLIPKKMPILLLDAFAQIRKDTECALLMVGEGQLKPEVQKIVAERKISDVILTGFINQSKLSEAYIAADILVLPSSKDETWGLVINEGMNFKLPLIISDAVGCAPDLVYDNKNGFIFKNGSLEELSDNLSKLILDKTLRESFGETSYEIIQNFGIDENCDRFIQAARSLMES